MGCGPPIATPEHARARVRRRRRQPHARVRKLPSLPRSAALGMVRGAMGSQSCGGRGHCASSTPPSLPPSAHRPSSEWRMHLDVYNSAPAAKAIVHAHPTYCTALSAHRKPIPVSQTG